MHREQRERLRETFHRNGYCIIENCFKEDHLNTAFSNTLEKVKDDWWLSIYPSPHANDSESAWIEVDTSGVYKQYLPHAHWAAAAMGENTNILTYAFLRTKNEKGVDELQHLLYSLFEDITYITSREPSFIDSCFLSAYEPGCFLATHSDEFNTPAPTLAFVLGLSKEWAAHWGGLTLVEGDEAATAIAIKPMYNCLTLFKIPIWHMVTEVAQCAPHKRFAFSGWLQTKPIPHPPSSFWHLPN